MLLATNWEGLPLLIVLIIAGAALGACVLGPVMYRVRKLLTKE